MWHSGNPAIYKEKICNCKTQEIFVAVKICFCEVLQYEVQK